jgi:hypothetical protein
LIPAFNCVVSQALIPHFRLFVDFFTTLTAQMHWVADLLESGALGVFFISCSKQILGENGADQEE